MPVHTDLRNLYRNLGGESELGPAISQPLVQPDGTVCQYTSNALLCYNSTARSEPDREYLAPLAKEFSLQSYTTTTGGSTPAIYEGFAEVYFKKFFGARYVGAPITPVLENKEKRRLEQYFERLGFFTLLDDPQKNVYLLAYGSYACREDCISKPPDSSIISWNKGVEVLAAKSIDRLGGYSLWGNPLGAPYRAKDGSLQQILEKAVVYLAADNTQVVRFRSIAVDLKMPRSAPVTQHFWEKDKMAFRPVRDDGLGYHVPVMFNEFIITHGGFEISGDPLSEIYEIQVNGQRAARQCFENYCLDFYPNESVNQQVQLVSLGQTYYQVLKQSEMQEPFVFNRSTVEMSVSEKKPQLTNQQRQVIQLVVRTRKSNQPIADIESEVMIAMPDGKKTTIRMPATNTDGITQVDIPVLNNVGNGVIIPYMVCLTVPSTEMLCITDSFLIWNNR